MPTRTIVIAGTHSGCGKTTATLGIMAALRRRGLTVQPFKAGPDFIDPGHHEAVTGRTSHNLDGWMMGEDAVRAVFSRYAQDADVAVIEGVMGLFDGLSGTSEDGSTAQLAKWLGAPVVLVADARSMARSACALAAGYADFDKDLQLAGVLFNRVGSDNHARILEEALGARPDIRFLGCLRRSEDLALPSRHLGLVTADDHAISAETITCLADWVDAGANPGALASLAPELDCPPPAPAQSTADPVRIGVARDQAFCFYYHENLRQLQAAGAEIVPFSPLADSELPPNLDGLYLGGGYPELHAAALAANTTMRTAVRAFSRAGKPVYAECGGFMYLMDTITDAKGKQHPMAGAFAMNATMDTRFRALGYREAVTTAPTIFGPEWTMLRGHEFHYSSPTNIDDAATPVYKVQSSKGWTGQKEGFQKNNTLGSYIHLHFASNPEAAPAFVAACQKHKPPAA